MLIPLSRGIFVDCFERFLADIMQKNENSVRPAFWVAAIVVLLVILAVLLLSHQPKDISAVPTETIETPIPLTVQIVREITSEVVVNQEVKIVEEKNPTEVALAELGLSLSNSVSVSVSVK